MNSIEQDIFNMYDTIKFSTNPICNECRKNNYNLGLPVSIWHIGSQFDGSQYRILFIGKNARGNPGKVYHDFIDSREVADELINGKWAIWNYTKAISNDLYGDDGWENISFTNIVKCNNSADKDTTTDDVKEKCIINLGVVRKEIEIIKPLNIVLYVGNSYDNYIENIFDKVEEVENKSITIGEKNMPWHYFFGYVNDHKIRVLRIGHPERMKKVDFIRNVADWIKDK